MQNEFVVVIPKAKDHIIKVDWSKLPDASKEYLIVEGMKKTFNACCSDVKTCTKLDGVVQSWNEDKVKEAQAM